MLYSLTPAAIEPTVVQLPGQNRPRSRRGPYLYAPNSTDCPDDDWTCYVHPLTSCNSSHLDPRQWREPYELTWLQRTLKHAKLADPDLLKVWDEVVSDLGGGSSRVGQRALAMIARAWASRPLPRMKREAYSILEKQGLAGRGVLDGCLAIHLRRSDNNFFKGGWRPVFDLATALGLAKEVIGSIEKVLLLSDTELGEEELSAAKKLPLFMLRRFRGGTDREYADHLPTKNATLEVAYIFAELELVSKCTGFVYQQGAFAGLLWETLCRARGGWGSCFDKVSKAALCDVCCEAYNVREGTFNQTQQSCNGKRIPVWACPGVSFC